MRWSGHRCLLDVGGGEGTFLAAAATRAPSLRLMLFDLPAVAARAEARSRHRARASACGWWAATSSRIRFPQAPIVVSLVRVVHDHDDAAALALLRAVRRALPADGTLILAEPMSGTPGAEPIGDAYFGFYLPRHGQRATADAGRTGNPAAARRFRATSGGSRPACRCKLASWSHGL